MYIIPVVGAKALAIPGYNSRREAIERVRLAR